MINRQHILLIEIMHLKKVLLESRLDFLKQKYIPLLDKAWKEKRLNVKNLPSDSSFHKANGLEETVNAIFNIIADADPDLQKKNTQWLLNLAIKGQIPLEDLYKATKYLTVFAQIKNNIPVPQRNIMSYKSLPQLFDVIKYAINEPPPVSKGEEKRNIKKEMYEQAQIIMNSPEYQIVVPLTKEASCYFGINTEWCTAATDSHNAFESYHQDGPLYIILEKKTNTRWQYHYESGQFQNENDDSIDVTKFSRSHYIVAKALVEDIIKRNPKDFKMFGKDNVILREWKDIEECIEEIGTNDGKTYYKYYIKNDSWIYDIDTSVDYQDDYASDLLYRLEKKNKEMVAKLGQWFFDKYKNEVDINEIVEDYDPENYRDILILDDDVEDHDFRSAVTSSVSTGREVGAQNEAFNVFKKAVESSPNLVWLKTTGNQQSYYNQNVLPDEEKEWTGEYIWDAPVGFNVSIEELTTLLDVLSEIPNNYGVGEIAEKMNVQIDIDVPYNGFSNVDDNAEVERFIEEINEFIDR